MPIMSAAKVLAGHLAGQTVRLIFPVMPVAIKTPALPLVVAPPVPGTSGDWQAIGCGEWQWLDAAGVPRGFALAGAATARRTQVAKALAVAV
jgi:rubredoxin-NAD+ reductase